MRRTPSPCIPWGEFAGAAPDLAAHGHDRLIGRSLALLGTLRPDGSPRISPIEPRIATGRLLIGAMRWSQKAVDLRRDPRYSLHSVVVDVNGADGEFQVFGVAERVMDKLLRVAADAWWMTAPRAADVFDLYVGRASLVTWNIERGEMWIRQWSTSRGEWERRRSYP
jgi:hypothetical protein